MTSRCSRTGTLYSPNCRIGSTSFVQSVDIGAALNADGRLPVWKFAIEESLKHPLTGAALKFQAPLPPDMRKFAEARLALQPDRL